MPSLVKEVPVETFKALLSPLESASRYSFDPRSEGRFEQNDEGRLRFILGGDDFGITSDAYIQLGQMLGIPGSYIAKTPHSIMMPHVNYWLRAKNMAQVTAAVQYGVIQVWSKGSAAPVDNSMIVDKIANFLGVGDAHLQVCHVNHSLLNTRYSVVSDQFEEAVKVGGPVRVGISINNSYALKHPLQIATYVHRLVCTNGAVSSDNVFSFSRGGNDAEEWLDEVIEDAFRAANKEMDRLRKMNDMQLNTEHINDTLGSVFTELGVPVSLRQSIMERAVNEGPVSMYDLYNTLTWVGSNSTGAFEDPDLAYRLMQIGGRLAAHPERCGECHRLHR